MDYTAAFEAFEFYETMVEPSVDISHYNNIYPIQITGKEPANSKQLTTISGGEKS